MDRKSKIENLNRKYLGGGASVTAIRSENILGAGTQIGGVSTNVGGLAFGRGASTIGTIGGGVTTLGGVTGGVTTIGGIGGGIQRVGGTTNITRVSAISPAPVSYSPPAVSYSPPAITSPTLVRGSAVRQIGVNQSALGNLISGNQQTLGVNQAALGNLISGNTYVKPATATNIYARRSIAAPVVIPQTFTPTYTQVPVTTTIAAGTPVSTTVVTKEVHTEPAPEPVVQTTVVPPPVVTQTPVVDTSTVHRRKDFGHAEIRRPGCCQRFNALCRPCCGCPWWVSLLIGLVLLSLLAGLLGPLLKSWF